MGSSSPAADSRDTRDAEDVKDTKDGMPTTATAPDSSTATGTAAKSSSSATGSADSTTAHVSPPPSYPHWTTEAERIADARKRLGDYYANRLTVFLKDTPARPKGGIVFLGDSISERLPLDAAFPGRNMVNRGIGGDHIPGVIERLDVSVERLEPERVYLLIGVNDLVWVKNKSINDFVAQYSELLTKLEKAAPEATILVESVLPTRGTWAKHNAKVDEFNALIRPLAEGKGFDYVDLHPWMSDAEGELIAEYTIDGIHLSLEGNLAWLECLLPREEFLEAALNLAPHRSKDRSAAHAIDAVDPTGEGSFPGGRGADQLIVYTPAYGKATTGTNAWGYEVVVRNGVATSAGGNDSPIPPDGFVVSSHGEAAAWVRQNLAVGAQVKQDGQTVSYSGLPETEMSPGQRLRSLRYRVLDALPELAAKGRDSAGFREAVEILEAIHALQGKGPNPDVPALEAIEWRVNALVGSPTP